MRTATLFSLGLLISAGVFGQSAITGSCQNGGTYPNCVGGEIVFRGTNYTGQVHVTVTNSSGKVIDDGDYTTDGGNLAFTENLSFADTYTISINQKVALTVTTT